MTQVLVIGNRGLVGSHVASALARAGHSVHGLPSSATPALPPRVHPTDYDLIINAAGQIWGDPETIRRRLEIATADAIDAATAADCPLIHIGSSLEYGPRSSPQWSEETAELRPTSPYARHKAATSKQALKYPRSVVIRSGLVLSRDISSRSLLGKIRNQAAAIDTRANTVPAKALSMVRNPVHVDDLARAVATIAKYALQQRLTHNVYNCAGPSATTVGTLAAHVRKQYSLPPLEVDPSVPALYDLISTDRLRQETGWQPRYSIESGDWLD
ncbi:NAD-dependent epimerase/dehydratase family protein [Rhodococcus sp. HS-D2]|uniref:NAD-dependent epimerase/dehydratase family protein n=1 Tax=Rhodococcus sp. HS-D2 TaxID=1384636 RepID=UPI0009EE8DAF